MYTKMTSNRSFLKDIFQSIGQPVSERFITRFDTSQRAGRSLARGSKIGAAVRFTSGGLSREQRFWRFFGVLVIPQNHQEPHAGSHLFGGFQKKWPQNYRKGKESGSNNHLPLQFDCEFCSFVIYLKQTDAFWLTTLQPHGISTSFLAPLLCVLVWNHGTNGHNWAWGHNPHCFPKIHLMISCCGLHPFYSSIYPWHGCVWKIHSIPMKWLV